MNTRGLTELIVLNLALEKGVISDALFAMLVIMALVTTLMAGPLLRMLDPKNELGAPVEEELEEAREESVTEFPALEVPEQSILVAPQGDALEQLLALGGAACALRAAARADRVAAHAPAAGRRHCAAASRPRTGS